jgi:hypothetical protein
MSSPPDRSGAPAWLIAVLPLAVAVAIGAGVLTLFPGAEPAGTTPSLTPSSVETPAPAAIASPRATPHAPEPTPHPATRRGMAWSVADGTLYLVGGVAGGFGTSSGPTTSVVAFDGSLWHDLPPIPAPRSGAALGALPDGTLVLAGGRLGGSITDTTLVLEPGAAEWTEAAPMPHPQSHAAYAVLDGVLYLVGGLQPGRGDATLSFDLQAGTWASLASLPRSVSRASAVAHDGMLYVTGGDGANGAAVGDASRYDPVSGTWTALSAVPTPVRGHASAVVDGRLWLLGTGEFTPQGFAPIPVYDIATDAWTLVDDTNGTAAGEGVAAMAQPSGEIMLIGALGGASTVRTSP